MSPAFASLLSGWMNFLVMISMIIIAADYLEKNKQFEIIENSIVYAGILISVLIILAFFNEINLSDFLKVGSGKLSASNLEVFFPKGSFFYNNVFYVIGISLLIVFSKIITENNKLMWLIVFLVILFGFQLFFNKTAIVAIIISLLYCLFVSRSEVTKTTAIILCIIASLIFIGFVVILSLDERIWYLVHAGSLQARFTLIDSIITAFNYNPIALFLGYGPESLLRVDHTEDYFIELVKTSANGVEGTVDSGIVSYLIEFGVFFLVIYLIIFIISIYTGLKKYIITHTVGNYKSVPYYGGACFLYVLLCSWTQMLSTSKISWIVVLMLSCICLCFAKAKRERNGIDNMLKKLQSSSS